MRRRRSQSFRRNPSLMASKIRRYEKRLTSLIEDARTELESLVDRNAGREMEGLDLNSTILLAQLNSILIARILDPGKGLVTDEAVDSFNAGQVRADQFLGIKASLKIPTDKRVIETLKLRSLTGLQGITDQMSKEIMQVITDGVLQGDGPRDIARAISERVDVSKSRAKTIARTESMSAFNQGAKKRYEQHGVSRVEWSYAGEDGRTCSQCRALDGRQWDLGDEEDCPLHPNCRCVLLPVIPKLEDL